jgi:hypothetical protein
MRKASGVNEEWAWTYLEGLESQEEKKWPSLLPAGWPDAEFSREYFESSKKDNHMLRVA